MVTLQSQQPAVVAAKGAAKKATNAKLKQKPSTEIVTVKPGALSVDVGPQVLAMFLSTSKDAVKIEEMKANVAGKTYDMLALLTLGIVKAAQNDDSINLPDAFKADARASVNKLNDQLRIALGISEVVQVSDGVSKIADTKAAAKVMGTMNKTQKTNFAHMLKKCIGTAQGVIELGATATHDKVAHTLLLEGPKIKSEFGQSKILLNEKQTVGEGDSAVLLSKKPSFTAIGDIGKMKNGVMPSRRVDSRANNAGVGTVSYSSDAAFTTLCKTFIKALEAIDKFSGPQTAALESVQSAIETALG